MFYEIKIDKSCSFEESIAYPSKFISVIKSIKDYFFLGLKESKDYFDNGFLVEDKEYDFDEEAGYPRHPDQKYKQTSKEYWESQLNALKIEYTITPFDKMPQKYVDEKESRIERQKFVAEAIKWVNSLEDKERQYFIYFGAHFPEKSELK